MKQKSSKCWECGKASGGCAWSREGKPVNGWIATEKQMPFIWTSYRVDYCPEFEEDKAEYHANDELITAICQRIARDYKYLMVFRIKQPERKDVQIEIGNLQVGILADIYSKDMIKTIFRKLRDEVKEDLQIMDEWLECKTDEDKEKLYEKYGKGTVIGTVKHYYIHPYYIHHN